MGKHSRLLETMPNFFLFFLFAASMLITLLAGAKIYQSVSAVMEEQYTTTTCVNYVSAKVRHYDRAEGISLGMLEDVEALVLWDTYEGETYKTYLYSYEGYLMELFCGEDAAFSPYDGQQILALDGIDFSLEENILTIAYQVGEQNVSSVLTLHSQKGGRA